MRADGTDGGRFDAVVAGGGLAGATAALALARGGLAVAGVDAGAGPDPRWSAVSHAALTAWETLGVRGLREGAQPLRCMVVSDGPRPGAAAPGWALAASLQFDAAELGGGDAPLAWMVENSAARAALDAALEAAGVVRVAPARVEDVRAGTREAVVRLADGRELTAPLVVGAEGRRSAVRAAAGVEVQARPYRQAGLAATVRLLRPHEGVARQLFLPDGPLAVLPLPGDRASLVWTTGRAEAEALAALPAEAFEALLARRLGEGLGPAVLEGPRTVFPLERRLSAGLTGPRTALVGDAAHAIHPVAGQGLNLGLKDAAALAEVVADARRLGEDWGADAVLARYARWRRFDRTALAAGADLFARGFSTAGPLARAVRTAGLAAAGGSAAARRALMREAGATAGEPPRLFRGEAV